MPPRGSGDAGGGSSSSAARRAHSAPDARAVHISQGGNEIRGELWYAAKTGGQRRCMVVTIDKKAKRIAVEATPGTGKTYPRHMVFDTEYKSIAATSWFTHDVAHTPRIGYIVGAKWYYFVLEMVPAVATGGPSGNGARNLIFSTNNHAAYRKWEAFLQTPLRSPTPPCGASGGAAARRASAPSQQQQQHTSVGSATSASGTRDSIAVDLFGRHATGMSVSSRGSAPHSAAVSEPRRRLPSPPRSPGAVRYNVASLSAAASKQRHHSDGLGVGGGNLFTSQHLSSTSSGAPPLSLTTTDSSARGSMTAPSSPAATAVAAPHAPAAGTTRITAAARPHAMTRSHSDRAHDKAERAARPRSGGPPYARRRGAASSAGTRRVPQAGHPGATRSARTLPHDPPATLRGRGSSSGGTRSAPGEAMWLTGGRPIRKETIHRLAMGDGHIMPGAPATSGTSREGSRGPSQQHTLSSAGGGDGGSERHGSVSIASVDVYTVNDTGLMPTDGVGNGGREPSPEVATAVHALERKLEEISAAKQHLQDLHGEKQRLRSEARELQDKLDQRAAESEHAREPSTSKTDLERAKSSVPPETPAAQQPAAAAHHAPRGKFNTSHAGATPRRTSPTDAGSHSHVGADAGDVSAVATASAAAHDRSNLTWDTSSEGGDGGEEAAVPKHRTSPQQPLGDAPPAAKGMDAAEQREIRRVLTRLTKEVHALRAEQHAAGRRSGTAHDVSSASAATTAAASGTNPVVPPLPLPTRVGQRGELSSDIDDVDTPGVLSTFRSWLGDGSGASDVEAVDTSTTATAPQGRSLSRSCSPQQGDQPHQPLSVTGLLSQLEGVEAEERLAVEGVYRRAVAGSLELLGRLEARETTKLRPTGFGAIGGGGVDGGIDGAAAVDADVDGGDTRAPPTPAATPPPVAVDSSPSESPSPMTRALAYAMGRTSGRSVSARWEATRSEGSGSPPVTAASPRVAVGVAVGGRLSASPSCSRSPTGGVSDDVLARDVLLEMAERRLLAGGAGTRTEAYVVTSDAPVRVALAAEAAYHVLLHRGTPVQVLSGDPGHGHPRRAVVNIEGSLPRGEQGLRTPSHDRAAALEVGPDGAWFESPFVVDANAPTSTSSRIHLAPGTAVRMIDRGNGTAPMVEAVIEGDLLAREEEAEEGAEETSMTTTPPGLERLAGDGWIVAAPEGAMVYPDAAAVRASVHALRGLNNGRGGVRPPSARATPTRVPCGTAISVTEVDGNCARVVAPVVGWVAVTLPPAAPSSSTSAPPPAPRVVVERATAMRQGSLETEVVRLRRELRDVADASTRCGVLEAAHTKLDETLSAQQQELLAAVAEKQALQVQLAELSAITAANTSSGNASVAADVSQLGLLDAPPPRVSAGTTPASPCTQCRHLREELELSQREQARINRQLDALAEEMDKMAAKKQILQAQVDILNKEWSDTDKKQAADENAALRAELEAAEDAREYLTAEVERLEQDYGATDAATLRAANDTLQSEIADANATRVSLEEDLTQIREALTAAEAAAAQSEALRREADGKLLVARTRSRSLTERGDAVSAFKAELVEVTRARDALQTQLDALAGQARDEDAGLAAQLADAVAARDRLADEAVEIEAVRDTAVAELTQLKDAMTSLKDALADAEQSATDERTRADAAAADVTARAAEIVALQTQITEEEEQHAARGAALEAEMAAVREELAALEEKMVAAQNAHATELKHVTEAAETRVAEAAAAAQKDVAAVEERLVAAVDAHTAEATALNGTMATRIAEADAAAAAAEAERAALQAEVTRLEDRVCELSASADSDRAAAEGTLGELRAELAEVRAALEADVARLEAEVHEERDLRASAETDIARLEGEVAEEQAAAEQLRAASVRGGDAEAALRRELEQYATELHGVLSEKLALDARVESLRDELVHAKTEGDERCAALDNDHAAALAAAAAQSAAEAGALRADIATLTAAVEDLRTANTSLEEEVAALTSAKLDVEGELAAARAANATQAGELAAAQAALARLEDDLKRARLCVEDLRTPVRGGGAASPCDASYSAEPKTPMAAQEQQQQQTPPSLGGGRIPSRHVARRGSAGAGQAARGAGTPAWERGGGDAVRALSPRQQPSPASQGTPSGGIGSVRAGATDFISKMSKELTRLREENKRLHAARAQLDDLDKQHAVAIDMLQEKEAEVFRLHGELELLRDQSRAAASASVAGSPPRGAEADGAAAAGGVFSPQPATGDMSLAETPPTLRTPKATVAAPVFSPMTPVEVSALHVHASSMEAELRASKRAEAVLRGEVDRLRADVRATTEAASAADAKIVVLAEIEAEKTALESEVDTLKYTRDALESRVKELEDENTSMRNRCADYARVVDAEGVLSSELEQHVLELAEVKTANTRQRERLAVLEAARLESEELVAQGAGEVEDLTARLAGVMAALARAEEAERVLADDADHHEVALGKARAKNQELEAELSATACDVEALREDLAVLHPQHAALLHDAAELRERCAMGDEDLAARDAALADLQSTLDEHRRELFHVTSVNDDLAAACADLRATLASKEEASAMATADIDTHALLTHRTACDLEDALCKLVRSRAGEAELRDALASERTTIAKFKEREALAKAEVECKSRVAAEVRGELQALKERAREAEAEQAEGVALLKGLREEVGALRALNTEAGAELHDRSTCAATLQAVVSELRTELTHVAGEKDAAAAAAASLEADLHDAVARLEQQAEAEAALHKVLDDLRASVSTATNECDELAAACQRADATVVSLERDLTRAARVEAAMWEEVVELRGDLKATRAAKRAVAAAQRAGDGRAARREAAYWEEVTELRGDVDRARMANTAAAAELVDKTMEVAGLRARTAELEAAAARANATAADDATTLREELTAHHTQELSSVAASLRDTAAALADADAEVMRLREVEVHLTAEAADARAHATEREERLREELATAAAEHERALRAATDDAARVHAEAEALREAQTATTADARAQHEREMAEAAEREARAAADLVEVQATVAALREELAEAAAEHARTLREAADDAARVGAEVEALRGAQATLSAAAGETRALHERDLADAAERAARAEDALADAKAEVEDLRGKHAAATAAATVLERELAGSAHLKTSAQELTESLRDARKLAAEYEARNATLQDALATARSTVDTTAQELKDANSKLAQAMLDKATLHADITTAKAEMVQGFESRDARLAAAEGEAAEARAAAAVSVAAAAAAQEEVERTRAEVCGVLGVGADGPAVGGDADADGGSPREKGVGGDAEGAAVEEGGAKLSPRSRGDAPLKTLVRDRIGELVAKLSAARAAIEGHKDDCNAAWLEKADLVNEIRCREEDLAAVEAERDELATRLAALQQRYASLQETHGAVEAQVLVLQQQTMQLNQQLMQQQQQQQQSSWHNASCGTLRSCTSGDFDPSLQTPGVLETEDGSSSDLERTHRRHATPTSPVPLVCDSASEPDATEPSLAREMCEVGLADGFSAFTTLQERVLVLENDIAAAMAAARTDVGTDAVTIHDAIATLVQKLTALRRVEAEVRDEARRKAAAYEADITTLKRSLANAERARDAQRDDAAETAKEVATTKRQLNHLREELAKKEAEALTLRLRGQTLEAEVEKRTRNERRLSEVAAQAEVDKAVTAALKEQLVQLEVQHQKATHALLTKMRDLDRDAAAKDKQIMQLESWAAQTAHKHAKATETMWRDEASGKRMVSEYSRRAEIAESTEWRLRKENASVRDQLARVNAKYEALKQRGGRGRDANANAKEAAPQATPRAEHPLKEKAANQAGTGMGAPDSSVRVAAAGGGVLQQLRPAHGGLWSPEGRTGRSVPQPQPYPQHQARKAVAGGAPVSPKKAAAGAAADAGTLAAVPVAQRRSLSASSHALTTNPAGADAPWGARWFPGWKAPAQRPLAELKDINVKLRPRSKSASDASRTRGKALLDPAAEAAPRVASPEADVPL